MKTIVFYHAGCTDGFCAAWLFRKVFPDAYFVPVQYGMTLPMQGYREGSECEENRHFDRIDRDDHVFIVDFSFPREQMISLYEHLLLSGEPRGSLLVLDHHKTAEAACDGLSFCRFDSSKSGAMLAFEWLREQPDNEWRVLPPYLVDYTADRDLWLWKLPDSKAVNAAIRSYPMTFDVWDYLADSSVRQMKTDGAAILRYRQVLIDQHVRNAVEMEISGHNVLSVNCTCGEIISEVAEALIQDNAFSVCWFDAVKDNKRVFSLRSRGEFDVSEIARQHGGGGHKNAAGFSVVNRN